MTADTRTTRPGALALECLEALDRGAYELANTRESAAALSDLRALIARCEAAERERDALRAQVDTLREALADANSGNERLSADLDAVRHAHISAMVQRDKLCTTLAGVIDEADSYSDEMCRIGRGSMEFGSNAPGHSISGMARAALAAYRAERGK